jgi:UDP-glucose 4-epimerase
VRIGITGGAGFIGGHVADVAQERGHEPVLFDPHGRSTSGHEVILGDVRDDVAVTELAAHVDGIIHLAACLGTQETIQNPRPAAETNVKGGLNFLEAIAQYDIPGVYIGVGNHWMNNTYSISKTTVERFVQMFTKERSTRCNIVRLVNAYGPRQSVAPPFGPAKVRKITPAFVCRALTGQPLEVYGDGQQVSDMVHVRDGALALVTALEKAEKGTVFSDPVECGPKEHRTVNEVAQSVIDAVTDLGYDPVEINHAPMRPGEIPGAKVTADTSTLALVDMSPETLIPIDDGIWETVQWFEEHWLPGYLKALKK